MARKRRSRLEAKMDFKTDSDVTMLLRAWTSGDEGALQKLAPLVYADLRERAHRYMANERHDHPLESCALVHEAFLRMAEWKRIQWQNREQFLAVSSGLMRKVLVDFARAHASQKRGGLAGTLLPNLLIGDVLIAEQRAEKFLALDDALNRLSRIEPRKARVVELRFFGGLSSEEIAAILDINPFTVLRDWKFAKSWLRREMEQAGPYAS
jgi:RNA polymerase sigma-70 factor, ECF subfamily